MKIDGEVGITFDDVLLKPKRSRVKSRKEVDTSTYFSRRIRLNIPVVSSPMDTVTEHSMAIALARLGGLGVIHRFTSIDKQVEEVKKVKRAENIVISDPYKITKEATVKEVKKIFEEKGVSGLLVVDNGNRLIGIVTTRDILFQPDDRPVKEVMTPKERLIVASPNVDLEDAKKLLWRYRIEKLPIVDEEWRVRGLITAADIIKKIQYPKAARDRKGRLLVAAAIGIRGDYMERAEKLYEAEVDALVIDIAHGHMERALEVIKELKDSFGDDVDVIGGNIATYEGAKDVIKYGSDAVRVGIGPGSACTTRIVAGVGVPQLTAIMEAYKAAREYDVPVIADGGIRNPGDVVKALAAGASTVMIGRLFAGTDEAPGPVILRNGKRYKMYRGMASFVARLGKEIRVSGIDESEVSEYSYTTEGVEAFVEYKGSVEDIVKRLVAGVRAGMSYLGAFDIEELRLNAEFIRITNASVKESYPHDILLW